jgi:hypothetical protein
VLSVLVKSSAAERDAVLLHPTPVPKTSIKYGVHIVWRGLFIIETPAGLLTVA